MKKNTIHKCSEFFIVLLIVIVSTACLNRVNQDLIENKDFGYEAFLDAQNSCNKSNYFLSNGDFRLAIKEAMECSNEIHRKPFAMANLAIAYNGLGIKDSVSYFIGEAAKLGYPKRYFPDSLFQPNSISDLIYEEKFKVYESNTNFELRKELEEMLAKDQLYRKGRAYLNNDSLALLQDEIDSLNVKRLDEIISKYGWPSHQYLGFGIIPQAKIIAVHTDKEKCARYLDIVVQSCKNKQASWTEAETIMSILPLKDRITLKENLPDESVLMPMKYITFNSNNEIDNTDYSLLQINALKTVNTRTNKICYIKVNCQLAESKKLDPKKIHENLLDIIRSGNNNGSRRFEIDESFLCEDYFEDSLITIVFKDKK